METAIEEEREMAEERGGWREDEVEVVVEREGGEAGLVETGEGRRVVFNWLSDVDRMRNVS